MKQLSILFFALFLTVGCNKRTDVAENISNESLIKIYDNVGTWHNEALEVVYEGLKSGTINSPYSYIYTMNNFLKSKGFPKELRLENHVALPEDFSFYATLIIKEYAGELKEHLDDTYIIRDKYLLRKNCTLTERKQIIGMASVAKASSEYWAKNAIKWNAIANFNPRLQDGAKDIVLHDAYGAASGAVGGAVKGAMGGTVLVPGIGTVSGAACGGLAGMVVGAVSASVTSAAWNVFKKWIGWQDFDASCKTLSAYTCTREDSMQWFAEHLNRDSIPFNIDSLNLLP